MRSTRSMVCIRRWTAGLALVVPLLLGSGAWAADQALADRAHSAGLLRQDSILGAYEIAFQAASDTVLVAGTSSFDPNSIGHVYRLDGDDLSVKQIWQVPRRAFALGLNQRTATLYVGNTMDGSLTVVDANSGVVRGTIQLGVQKDGEEGVPHTRKVVIDEARDRVFVSSPGQQGMVWIVDGASGKLQHTIQTGTPWAAGLAYDAQRNRVYVSGGGQDEVLEIDPDAGKILRRLSTGDSQDNTPDGSKHFMINLALDAGTQRLFATDANTNQVYVFDLASGKVIRTLPVGLSALDIAFNARRNELYVSNRGVTREQPTGSGAVTVFDTQSYQQKRVIDLPVHPNSLALDDEGKVLYVTVKMPHGDKHPAARKGARDSVVRIALD